MLVRKQMTVICMPFGFLSSDFVSFLLHIVLYQARVLYDAPFSKEERESMKFMIQSKLYEYLGRLLEGRELFEEESLLEMRKRQSTDPSSSGNT